jgi:predicted alpha-1,2-mannosidase
MNKKIILTLISSGLILMIILVVFKVQAGGQKTKINSFVDCMIGTGSDANLLPLASVPFGLVQLGPDMYLNNSGYKYGSTDKIIGFSHTHMTGGGCTDYKDIMFFPLVDEGLMELKEFPDQINGTFSHEQEVAEPGYYSVNLINSGIDVALTATSHCGMHQYTYPESSKQQLVIDLKYGHNAGCTVCPGYDYDTVRVSYIEVVDEKTIKGYRVSDGWLTGVNVHFYAEFSKPIKNYKIFQDKKAIEGISSLEGRDVRMMLEFDNADSKPLLARVGISPVDVDGAKLNLQKQIDTWQFQTIKKQAQKSWENALSAIEIKDDNLTNKQMFYTMLYRATFYPQIYSDTDGRFRSSDNKVHQGNFPYYAGALSLWDAFRAQLPLITLLRADIANDLMKTFLEHYRNFGQLPQWTGAGIENWCMIGLPAHSVIADMYSKDIKDYDIEALYQAMIVSANVDTFGFSEGNCVYKGTWLYKQYDGYIPCELDINAAAKSLEFNYSDWSLAQVAKMLGKKADYDHYMHRASGYKQLFDSTTNLLCPKHADGSWRTPFDPVLTMHYRKGDDYCEGTAYQWTFFVPHDPRGLANLMGGNDKFVEQLDSLFIRSSLINTGGYGAPDLNPKGMIGQYAHANEPSQHTIYLYNAVGQPWKTQKWIDTVRKTLYHNAPDGLNGNDDLGQMSAWYVFSAMGFYPVTHGEGLYYIGTPMFKDLSLKHKNGMLNIKANNVSEKNIYIQSVTLNGKPYTRNWLKHEDIFGNTTKLVFEMGNTPNKNWGSADKDLPPSMSDIKNK